MNYKVIAHSDVEPRPNNKATITVRITAAGDDGSFVRVADVDVLMYAPVLDAPGKFVIEEVTKVLTQLGACGKIQMVKAGALELLNGGRVIKP